MWKVDKDMQIHQNKCTHAYIIIYVYDQAIAYMNLKELCDEILENKVIFKKAPM